jgi:hypothetical protein
VGKYDVLLCLCLFKSHSLVIIFNNVWCLILIFNKCDATF